MAITIYTEREIAGIRRASRAAAATLWTIAGRLEPGITTAAIDRWVREDTARRGGRPSQLGYHGFPASVCTSRNAVICHGIPSEADRLEVGDIVNVDVTTELDGFHGDTSATFVIGEGSASARRLVDAARRARDAGIAALRPGGRLGDVGAAIVGVAEAAGFSVVRDYCGHGIGRKMHEQPQVRHVGVAGRGLRLRPGMVMTVEPMLNAGDHRHRLLADGWTVVTADGSLSAQFEHTVAITEAGAEILTLPPDELG
ncbi:MAG: type I methionyl aminopeptidase [Myxococcales bacterium]|nr:type I methionyl aminopeptidase [Myxococcales bacterium]MCB9706365.1 type I methionyl aminopeptidase [Myxococcales bacterium]